MAAGRFRGMGRKVKYKLLKNKMKVPQWVIFKNSRNIRPRTSPNN